jgi:hypothetical protein
LLKTPQTLPGAAGTATHGSLLASAQVVIAVMLLVGAALEIKTLVRLENVDTGFDRQNLLILQLNVPAALHSSREALSMFYRHPEERARV